MGVTMKPHTRGEIDQAPSASRIQQMAAAGPSHSFSSGRAEALPAALPVNAAHSQTHQGTDNMASLTAPAFSCASCYAATSKRDAAVRKESWAWFAPQLLCTKKLPARSYRSPFMRLDPSCIPYVQYSFYNILSHSYLSYTPSAHQNAPPDNRWLPPGAVPHR
jgi:hypothetical protein